MAQGHQVLHELAMEGNTALDAHTQERNTQEWRRRGGQHSVGCTQGGVGISNRRQPATQHPTVIQLQGQSIEKVKQQLVLCIVYR